MTETHNPTPAATLRLSTFEARVLGVLIEKRFVTPDVYPLSVNSLTLGCNQLTGRDPVMALSETAVLDTLALLTERKLAAARQQAGARVIKYEHRLIQHIALDDETTALLGVLLLRGPQTLGELKQRTERMVAFADLAAVDVAMGRLSALGVAVALPKAPGTKEPRFIETLTDPADRGIAFDTTAQGYEDASNDMLNNTPSNTFSSAVAASKGRLGDLEDEVARLKRDLSALTHAFMDFKQRLD